MKEEITILFAAPEDIPQIINLCRQHALYEKAEYDDTGKHQKLQDDLFSDDPPLKCLVAKVNEDIVGYATYMKQYSTWDTNFYLTWIACFSMNNPEASALESYL